MKAVDFENRIEKNFINILKLIACSQRKELEESGDWKDFKELFDKADKMTYVDFTEEYDDLIYQVGFENDEIAENLETLYTIFRIAYFAFEVQFQRDMAFQFAVEDENLRKEHDLLNLISSASHDRGYMEEAFSQEEKDNILNYLKKLPKEYYADHTTDTAIYFIKSYLDLENIRSKLVWKFTDDLKSNIYGKVRYPDDED